MTICDNLTFKNFKGALQSQSIASTTVSAVLNALIANEPQECKDCITLTCTNFDANFDACEQTCFT